MDELDLYDDLDEFQEQQEKKSKELQHAEDKFVEATKTIQNLQDENKGLKKKIKRIELSFQSLLDTARNEIKRKDKEIERLRKEKDDICFRRKFPNRPQKPMESAATHQLAAKSRIALPESKDFLPLEVTTNANDVSETKGRGRSPERFNDSSLDTHKRHRSRDGHNAFQEYKRQRNDDDVAAKPLFYRRDSRHDECAEESQKSLDFQRRDTSQDERRGRSAKNERNEKTDHYQPVRNRDRYDKDCGYERRKTSRTTANSPERSDYRNQRSESHRSSKDHYGRKNYFSKSPVRRENVDCEKYNSNDTKTSECRGRHHSNKSPDHRHRDESRRIRSPNKTDGKGRGHKSTDQHSFRQASSDSHYKKPESKERDHHSTGKYGDKKALTDSPASANVELLASHKQSRCNEKEHSINSNEVGGFHHNSSEHGPKNDNPDIQSLHKSHNTTEATESLTSALTRIMTAKDPAKENPAGSSMTLKIATKDVHEKDGKLQQTSNENSENVDENAIKQSKEPQRPLITNNKNISVEDYLYGNFDEHQQDIGLETYPTDNLKDTQHLDVDDIENMLYGNLEDDSKMDKDKRVKYQMEECGDGHKAECSSLSQTRDNPIVEVYEIPDDDIRINKANEQEDVDLHTNPPIVVEDVGTCRKSTNEHILHVNLDGDVEKLLQRKSINSQLKQKNLIDSNLSSMSCTPHKVALFDTLFGPSPSSASSSASNTIAMNSISGILSKSKDEDNDSTITSPSDYSNDTATNIATDNHAQQFDNQELDKCFKKNADLTLSSPGDTSSDCVVVETTSKQYDETELDICFVKVGGKFKSSEQQSKWLKDNTNKGPANKALEENNSGCGLIEIPKAADVNPLQVTPTNCSMKSMGSACDSEQQEVNSTLQENLDNSAMVTTSPSRKVTDVSPQPNGNNEVRKCLAPIEPGASQDNTKMANKCDKSATITSHGDFNDDEVSLSKQENSFTSIVEGSQEKSEKTDISDLSSTTKSQQDSNKNCRLIFVTPSKQASDVHNNFATIAQESQQNIEKNHTSDQSSATTSAGCSSDSLITVPSSDKVVPQNLNDTNVKEYRFTTTLDQGLQEPTEISHKSNNTSATTFNADTSDNNCPAVVTLSNIVVKVSQQLYDTNELENHFRTIDKESQQNIETPDKCDESSTSTCPGDSASNCPAVVTPSNNVVKVSQELYDTNETENRFTTTLEKRSQEPIEMSDQSYKSSTTTCPGDSSKSCPAVVTASNKVVEVTPSLCDKNEMDNCLTTIARGLQQHAGTPDQTDKSSTTTTSPADSDSDCLIIVTPSKEVAKAHPNLYNKNEIDNCFTAIGDKSSTTTSCGVTSNDSLGIVMPSMAASNAFQQLYDNVVINNSFKTVGEAALQTTETPDRCDRSSTSTSPADSDSDCLIIVTPSKKAIEVSAKLYNKNELDNCFVAIGQHAAQESRTPYKSLTTAAPGDFSNDGLMIENVVEVPPNLYNKNELDSYYTASINPGSQQLTEMADKSAKSSATTSPGDSDSDCLIIVTPCKQIVEEGSQKLYDKNEIDKCFVKIGQRAKENTEQEFDREGYEVNKQQIDKSITTSASQGCEMKGSAKEKESVAETSKASVTNCFKEFSSLNDTLQLNGEQTRNNANLQDTLHLNREQSLKNTKLRNTSAVVTSTASHPSYKTNPNNPTTSANTKYLVNGDNIDLTEDDSVDEEIQSFGIISKSNQQNSKQENLSITNNELGYSKPITEEKGRNILDLDQLSQTGTTTEDTLASEEETAGLIVLHNETPIDEPSKILKLTETSIEDNNKQRNVENCTEKDNKSINELEIVGKDHHGETLTATPTITTISEKFKDNKSIEELKIVGKDHYVPTPIVGGLNVVTPPTLETAVANTTKVSTSVSLLMPSPNTALLSDVTTAQLNSPLKTITLDLTSPTKEDKSESANQILKQAEGRVYNFSEKISDVEFSGGGNENNNDLSYTSKLKEKTDDVGSQTSMDLYTNDSSDEPLKEIVSNKTSVANLFIAVNKAKHVAASLSLEVFENKICSVDKANQHELNDIECTDRPSDQQSVTNSGEAENPLPSLCISDKSNHKISSDTQIAANLMEVDNPLLHSSPTDVNAVLSAPPATEQEICCVESQDNSVQEDAKSNHLAAYDNKTQDPAGKTISKQLNSTLNKTIASYDSVAMQQDGTPEDNIDLLNTKTKAQSLKDMLAGYDALTGTEQTSNQHLESSNLVTDHANTQSFAFNAANKDLATPTKQMLAIQSPEVQHIVNSSTVNEAQALSMNGVQQIKNSSIETEAHELAVEADVVTAMGMDAEEQTDNDEATSLDLTSPAKESPENQAKEDEVTNQDAQHSHTDSNRHNLYPATTEREDSSFYKNLTTAHFGEHKPQTESLLTNNIAARNNAQTQNPLNDTNTLTSPLKEAVTNQSNVITDVKKPENTSQHINAVSSNNTDTEVTSKIKDVFTSDLCINVQHTESNHRTAYSTKTHDLNDKLSIFDLTSPMKISLTNQLSRSQEDQVPKEHNQHLYTGINPNNGEIISDLTRTVTTSNSQAKSTAEEQAISMQHTAAEGNNTQNLAEASSVDLTSPSKEAGANNSKNRQQNDAMPEDGIQSGTVTTLNSKAKLTAEEQAISVHTAADGNNTQNLAEAISVDLTSPSKETGANNSKNRQQDDGMPENGIQPGTVTTLNSQAKSTAEEQTISMHSLPVRNKPDDDIQPIDAAAYTTNKVSTADLCNYEVQSKSSSTTAYDTKTQDSTEDSATFDLTSLVKDAFLSQTYKSQEDPVPKDDKHLNTVINPNDLETMECSSDATGTVTTSDSEAKSTADACATELQTMTASYVNKTQNLSLDLTSPIRETKAQHSYRLQYGIQHIDDFTAYTGTEFSAADLYNIELQSKSNSTRAAQIKTQDLTITCPTIPAQTKTQDMADETVTMDLPSPPLKEMTLNQSYGSKANPTTPDNTKTQDPTTSSPDDTKTQDQTDETVTLDLTMPAVKELTLNQSCGTQGDAASDLNIQHLNIVNKSIELTNVSAATVMEETIQMEIEDKDLNSTETEAVANETSLKHWMTSQTNSQQLLKEKETAVNIPGLDLIQPESLGDQTMSDVISVAKQHRKPNDDNPPITYKNVTKSQELGITHAVVGSYAAENSSTSRTESYDDKTPIESEDHTEEEYLYLNVSGKVTEESSETLREHSRTTDNSYVVCETQQKNPSYLRKKKDTKAVIIPGLDLVHTEKRQYAAELLKSIANKSPSLADKKVIDLNSNDVGVHHAVPPKDICESFLKADETIYTLEYKSAQVTDSTEISTPSLTCWDSRSLREQCKPSKDLNEYSKRQLEECHNLNSTTTGQSNDKPEQNNTILSLDAIEPHPDAESSCQAMALKLNAFKSKVLKNTLANKDNKNGAIAISSSLSQDNIVQEIETSDPTNTSYDNDERSYLWSEIENFVIKKKINVVNQQIKKPSTAGAKVQHIDDVPSTQPKTCGGRRQHDVISKLDGITSSGSLNNKAEQINLIQDCNELESHADASSKSQPEALEPKALDGKAFESSAAAKNKDTFETATDTQSSYLPKYMEQITLNSKVVKNKAADKNEQESAREISSDQSDQHIQPQTNSLYLAQILPHGQQHYPNVWLVGNTPSDGLHSIKESYDRSSSTQFDDIISYEQNLTIVENTAKQLVASTDILGGGEASHSRKAVSIQMGDKGSYTLEEFIAQPNYFRSIGIGGGDTDQISKEAQISSLSDSSKTLDANEFTTTAAKRSDKEAGGLGRVNRHLPYTTTETSSKNPTNSTLHTTHHSSPVTPPSSIGNSKDLPNSTQQQQQQVSSLNILNILKAAKISLCPLNTTPTTPKRCLSNSTVDSTNSLKTSTTISDNYGLPNILPSISTKCPTPPNFSGIFSKRNRSESVLEDVEKNKQKLINTNEHNILPATRVRCNIKNLENEMTEIEDDTDIDNSDEERPLIQENKGNVNTTLAKVDDIADKADKLLHTATNGSESPQSKKSNINRKSPIARRNTIDTLPAKCGIPSTKVLEELQRFKQLTITRVPPCKVNNNRGQSPIITHKTLSGASLMAAPAIRVKSAESLMAATDLVMASAIKTNLISTSLPVLSQHKNEFSLAANSRNNKTTVAKEQKTLPAQKRNRGRPPKQQQQQQQVAGANVGGRVSKGTKDNRAVNCNKEITMKNKQEMSSVAANGTKTTTDVKTTVAERYQKLTLETGGSKSSQNLGAHETAVPKDNRGGLEGNNAMAKAPALVGHNDYGSVARAANDKYSIVTAAKKTAANLNTDPICVDEESPLKSDDNSDKNTSLVYEKLHSSDEQNSSVAENSEPECNKYLKEDAAKVTKDCHVVLERTILDESNRGRMRDHGTKNDGSHLIFKPADKMALSNYKIPKLTKQVVESDSISNSSKNKNISLEDIGIKGRPFTAQLSTFKIPKTNKVGDEMQKNSSGALKSQNLVKEVKVTKKDQRVEKILEAAATLRGSVAYQRKVQQQEEKDEETCEVVKELQESDGNASFKERTAMASARQRALEEYSKRLNKVFNPLGFDLYADTADTDNKRETIEDNNCYKLQSTPSRHVLNTTKESESGLNMSKSKKETDKRFHHQANNCQESLDESNSEDEESVEKTKRNESDAQLEHKVVVGDTSGDTTETFNTIKSVIFSQRAKNNDNTPKVIMEYKSKTCAENKRKQATGTAAAKFKNKHETEHDEEELYAMYVKARNEYIRLQQQLLDAIGGEDGVTEREEFVRDDLNKTENAGKESTAKAIKMRRKTIHSLEENQEEVGENCSEYIKKKPSTAVEPCLTPVSKRRKSMYCETSYSPVPSQDTDSCDLQQNKSRNCCKKVAITETTTKESTTNKSIKLRRKSMYAESMDLNDNDEMTATGLDTKDKSSKPKPNRRKSMCADMMSRTCSRNTPELNGHYSNNSDVDQIAPNDTEEDKKPIKRNRRKSTHTPSYEEIDSDHDNQEEEEEQHIKKKPLKTLRPRRKSTYLERKEKLMENKIQKQTKLMNAMLCNIVDEGKPEGAGLKPNINTNNETQKDINDSDDDDNNLASNATETNRIEQNIEFVQSADVTPIKSLRMHKKLKQAEKLALEAKKQPSAKTATDNSNKDAEDTKTHKTQLPNNNLPKIVDNRPFVSGNMDIIQDSKSNQPIQNHSKSLYMETHQQSTNDPNIVDHHSDSDTLSTISPSTNANKMRRKSINLQRRILDSTSDDDECEEKTATMAATKPVIQSTIIAPSIPPAAATQHSLPRKRRRIVKVLSTSLENTPASKKMKYNMDQVEVTTSASPSPSHPIFHTQVTEKPQGSMTPFTHDARFSEIDSRLHDMFLSPQHEGELNKSLVVAPESTMMSSLSLSILPEPQLNVTGSNITIDETVCTQQEHNDSSVNISCSNDSKSLNTSSAAQNQSETKHLSLGSSEYRFEKVSDNVVNLFISRKRRRNKHTTN